METHLRKSILPPSSASLQISPGPPSVTQPTAITAKMAANIRSVCDGRPVRGGGDTVSDSAHTQDGMVQQRMC